jgi:hypothetical protein
MTAPRVWKRGFVSVGALLVVVMGAGVGVAQAELVFRKKAPEATDTSGLEGSPSGGEAAAASGEDGKPAAEGADTGPHATQFEDKDFPEAQAQRDKARADAALARQARNAQLAKKKDDGTPVYEKWQFWAITGGVVVGAVLAIWAGSAVFHQMNGGDIKGCMSPAGCYGEGR